MRTLLSFCAGVTTLCTPHCHSERSEESCRYFADAQYDTPLSLCAGAAMLCVPYCHSERSLLSFRTQYPVIPNAVSCHSERNLLSFRTQYPVIPNAMKILVDTSLTLSMTPHCHSARAQLCFAHFVVSRTQYPVIPNAVKNLFNNAQNEMSNFSAFPFWGKVD